MCHDLEWELTFDSRMLFNFERIVKDDFFCASGPFPAYTYIDVV
jgi:hypothetical protein